MTRRNIYILAISITLMLLVTLTVPAIAEEREEESQIADSTNVYTGQAVKDKGGPDKEVGGQEKVVITPQFAWVKYGPITQSSGAKYYYVGFGGYLSGKPVVVTGLAIPYSYPYYANQQFSINTESNYAYSSAQYVHVVSHDGKSLTGSYINLIGIY